MATESLYSDIQQHSWNFRKFEPRDLKPLYSELTKLEPTHFSEELFPVWYNFVGGVILEGATPNYIIHGLTPCEPRLTHKHGCVYWFLSSTAEQRIKVHRVKAFDIAFKRPLADSRFTGEIANQFDRSW